MIPGVPYDAEVEWIESTGTQWIDTMQVLDLRAVLSITGKAGFNTTSRGMLMSAYNSNTNFAIELFSS